MVGLTAGLWWRRFRFILIPASFEKLKMLRSLMSVALIASFSIVVTAEETATQPGGLSKGDPLGPFMVTKVAGAEDDGVEPGEPLCYRCRYGRSPMVMIFTRSTDGSVGQFVRKLGSEIEAKKDYRLRGLVTMIGGDPSELTRKANTLANESNVKNIPFVVAKDSAHGPSDYHLKDDTEVTVVIVNYSQVVATHNFASDQIDIDGVMKQVNQMLY